MKSMIIRSVLLNTYGQLDLLLQKTADTPAEYSNFLEWQVRTIQKMRRIPVILLGDDGDELLRQCRFLEFCQLAIFSPGGKTLVDAVQSGFDQIQNKHFILPAQIPCPVDTVFEQLENYYDDVPEERVPHIICLNSSQKIEFPILVTLRGCNFLKKQPLGTELSQIENLEIHSVTVRTPVSPSCFTA